MKRTDEKSEIIAGRSRMKLYHCNSSQTYETDQSYIENKFKSLFTERPQSLFKEKQPYQRCFFSRFNKRCEDTRMECNWYCQFHLTFIKTHSERIKSNKCTYYDKNSCVFTCDKEISKINLCKDHFKLTRKYIPNNLYIKMPNDFMKVFDDDILTTHRCSIVEADTADSHFINISDITNATISQINKLREEVIKLEAIINRMREDLYENEQIYSYIK